MKNVLKILIAFSFLFTTGFGQDLKQLLNELAHQNEHQINVDEINSDHKCGFSRRASIAQFKDRMTGDQISLYKATMTRPVLQNSLVSPKGYFRIHYDTSGPNEVKYDINEFATYCDQVYDKEVTEFGFKKPPSDNGEGGDDLYDIYILEFHSTYGETVFNALNGGTEIPSYIKIDNDFISGSFNTTGIDGAKVTIAHEFHHAIQVGYIWRGSDLFYYEMTSTAMEELVFSDINDYYLYLPGFFNKPYLSMNSTNSNYHYANCIFNLYLTSKFGPEIIKRVWELMPNDRAVGAINAALTEKGSGFKTEFNTFSDWIYFTGDYAKEGKYFPDAKDYPMILPTNSFKFEGSDYNKEMNYFTNPASNNFIEYVDTTGGSINKIMIRITNSDYASLISTSDNISVTTNFAKGNSIGDNFYKDYYFSKTVDADAEFITSEIFINGKLASELNNGNDNLSAGFVYPQPYNPFKNTSLNFTVESGSENTGTLYVFSLTMELLYSSELSLIPNGENYVINWNGVCDSGDKLSSGVYIYVVDSNDKLIKGKFAVINE